MKSIIINYNHNWPEIYFTGAVMAKEGMESSMAVLPGSRRISSSVANTDVDEEGFKK